MNGSIDFMKETEENIIIGKIWKLMEDVYDPELPVLSIVDLGIIRDIQLNNDVVEDHQEAAVVGIEGGHHLDVFDALHLLGAVHIF